MSFGVLIRGSLNSCGAPKHPALAKHDLMTRVQYGRWDPLGRLSSQERANHSYG